MTKVHPQTVYALTWGGDGTPETTRYFTCHNLSDVCVRFGERVLEFDGDDAVNGAYVHLNRLPDTVYLKGQHVLAWTKTSNERPTMEGFDTPEAAYWPPKVAA